MQLLMEEKVTHLITWISHISIVLTRKKTKLKTWQCSLLVQWVICLAIRSNNTWYLMWWLTVLVSALTTTRSVETNEANTRVMQTKACRNMAQNFCYFILISQSCLAWSDEMDKMKELTFKKRIKQKKRLLKIKTKFELN